MSRLDSKTGQKEKVNEPVAMAKIRIDSRDPILGCRFLSHPSNKQTKQLVSGGRRTGGQKGGMNPALSRKSGREM